MIVPLPPPQKPKNQGHPACAATLAVPIVLGAVPVLLPTAPALPPCGPSPWPPVRPASEQAAWPRVPLPRAWLAPPPRIGPLPRILPAPLPFAEPLPRAGPAPLPPAAPPPLALPAPLPSSAPPPRSLLAVELPVAPVQQQQCAWPRPVPAWPSPPPPSAAGQPRAARGRWPVQLPLRWPVLRRGPREPAWLAVRLAQTSGHPEASRVDR